MGSWYGWLMQESPGLKLDWCGVISSFQKKSKYFVKNKFFENLSTNREQGDWTIVLRFCFSGFLWIGMILPFFYSDGNKPDISAWKIWQYYYHMFLTCEYLYCRGHGPCWGRAFEKYFPFSSSENLIVEKRLSVTYLGYLEVCYDWQ